MEFYEGHVNLSGNSQNQVFMPRMSAPEVLLLKHIHGGAAEGEGVIIEPIVGLKYIGKEKVENGKERARLKSMYPPKYVDEVFGTAQYGPLPIEVDGAERPDIVKPKSRRGPQKDVDLVESLADTPPPKKPPNVPETAESFM